VVFGSRAGEAVANEAARRRIKRVFVTSTTSLTRIANGPLQRVVEGLGSTYVGQFTAIASHSQGSLIGSVPRMRGDEPMWEPSGAVCEVVGI
jgi:hypothetical protein